MRMICALLATLAILSQLPETPSKGGDIVIIVDTSCMTSAEAGDEPWLASPCLNPEHYYYKPLGDGSSSSSYPASSADGADLSVEYRFRSCFLLEDDAVGWRPWENHYTYDQTGALVRIIDPEASGCVYASDVCRTLALELIEEILESYPNCRVALCCVGGPFDTRFCVNFTRDGEKLLNALYAAAPSGIGDRSTALNKASEYIERRRADEQRTRPATVVVLSAEGEDDGLYAERTKEEALRLIKSAALLWVSPLEAEKEDILRLLGLGQQAPALRPSPISPRATARDRVYLLL